jgi:hypothetical protein
MGIFKWLFGEEKEDVNTDLQSTKDVYCCDCVHCTDRRFFNNFVKTMGRQYEDVKHSLHICGQERIGKIMPKDYYFPESSTIETHYRDCAKINALNDCADFEQSRYRAIKNN